MSDEQTNTEYDIAIIGAGPGGYVAALYAALKGAKVALIEKDKRLGGTCLLRGCIPSKAMVKTAELMLEMRHPDEFGLALEGTVRLDWERTVQRKDKVVDGLVNGLNGLLKARKVDVITGQGTITSPRTVMVDGREVRARNIIIATGSGTALASDVPGGNLPAVITSDDILDADLTMSRLPRRPDSMIVLGGGVVGVEAIGDVGPGRMLADLGMYGGEVAVENSLVHYRAADESAVADVMFTIPELASVGLTDGQAKDLGIPVKVTKFPFAALGRAQ